MKHYAKCPFYEEEKPKKLICEAGVIDFPAPQDRAAWLSMHCCSWNFKICKFYRQLMKKYDAI